MEERPTTRQDRFWSKKAPEDRVWDAIVIGSGIGGMTTAALLAKAGRRVLVLEQHYVPGGFTHVFRRKGYEWDVGVHIVGETSARSLPGRLMAEIAPDLDWVPVGDVYDEFHYPDNFKILFHSDSKVFAQTLKDAFPHEAVGIDNYLADVRNTVKAMRGFYLDHMLPGKLGRMLGGYLAKESDQVLAVTAAERVSKWVSDPKLQAVLLGQWGYHGATPKNASWGLQALVVRHFVHGAAYPKGGASAIAKSMLKTVADAGGWTRICADVAEIVVENGRAVGVKMVDGEVIRAKTVVSAAGANTTVAKLLPSEQREQVWARRTARLASGPAHLSLYIGFKGDISQAGATKQCQWFYNTWDHEQGGWDVHPDKPLSKPNCLFTSFPSLKDPEHDPGPENRHTGEMITFVPWESFERWQGTSWRKRGEEYEAFKDQMAKTMLEVLFEHRPALRGMLDYYELSTPLSTDLFVRPYHGSIYGLMGTPERYADPWLRPQTPIPGLYMAGSDVSAPGVVGAMMGGALAGIAMEPVAGVSLLRKIMRS